MICNFWSSKYVIPTNCTTLLSFLLLLLLVFCCSNSRSMTPITWQAAVDDEEQRPLQHYCHYWLKFDLHLTHGNPRGDWVGGSSSNFYIAWPHKARLNTISLNLFSVIFWKIGIWPLFDLWELPGVGFRWEGHRSNVVSLIVINDNLQKLYFSQVW